MFCQSLLHCFLFISVAIAIDSNIFLTGFWGFGESIMAKRLKDNKLVDINSDNPILGFPERKTFEYFDKIDKTDFNNWGKLKSLTIWLPDENFANIWVESL